jgi:uncharacterized protein
MSDLGQELYALQQIDLQIQEKQNRLEAIEKLLGDNLAVQKAQSQLEAAELALKPLEKELRNLEGQVQVSAEKHKSTEQQLYSGSVNNPKELQNMQNNLAALKKRQNELEETQLALMEEIEKAETLHKNAQDKLAAVKKEIEANNQGLIAEKQSLEAEIKITEAKRQKASATIEKTALNLYETLRPQKAFRPVARLSTDGSCSVCGIQQSNRHIQIVRQASPFGYCENCGRILIPF